MSWAALRSGHHFQLPNKHLCECITWVFPPSMDQSHQRKRPGRSTIHALHHKWQVSPAEILNSAKKGKDRHKKNNTWHCAMCCCSYACPSLFWHYFWLPVWCIYHLELPLSSIQLPDTPSLTAKRPFSGPPNSCLGWREQSIDPSVPSCTLCVLLASLDSNIRLLWCRLRWAVCLKYCCKAVGAEHWSNTCFGTSVFSIKILHRHYSAHSYHSKLQCLKNDV